MDVRPLRAHRVPSLSTMPVPSTAVTDEDLLAALVLLQRYKLELSQVAGDALGDGPTVGLDCEILVATHLAGGASPSELVDRLGIPRSTLARGLARLRGQGLVERTVDTVDARRAVLRPTPAGAAAVARFHAVLDGWLRNSAPVVKEVALLLRRDPEAMGSTGKPATVAEVTERINAVSAAYGRDVSAVAARHGLVETLDRFAVVYLARHASRPSLLAEHLHLTPAGTTSLLDRLEGLGLVERHTRALTTDRRAVLVQLSPAGRAAAAACLEAFERHHDAFVDALGTTLRLVASNR
jgi:DNA-binding MarR family transcriptional regulator